MCQHPVAAFFISGDGVTIYAKCQWHSKVVVDDVGIAPYKSYDAALLAIVKEKL